MAGEDWGPVTYKCFLFVVIGATICPTSRVRYRGNKDLSQYVTMVSLHLIQREFSCLCSVALLVKEDPAVRMERR